MTSCPYDFDGKVFGVTGVASGIGKELVTLLKSAGAHVVGFDVRQATDHIDAFVPLDLNDAASIEKAVADVSAPLDGLCNNAGLPPRAGLEKAILQVNFFGLRQFTNGMLTHLKDGASIVNMASRAGHGWRTALQQIDRVNKLVDLTLLDRFIADEALDAIRAYNLSKEAVIVWTMLQSEPLLERNIRINSISPGGVSTGILDDFAKAFGEKMAQNVERAGRPANPEEVARVAAFLLSEESAWVKGTDIAIDGGVGAFRFSDSFSTLTD